MLLTGSSTSELYGALWLKGRLISFRSLAFPIASPFTDIDDTGASFVSPKLG